MAASPQPTAAADAVASLDGDLATISVEGYWKTIGAMPTEPKPHGTPTLWRWADLYPRLFQASDVIDLSEAAERRSLRLCTPGLSWKATTETLTAAVQMVLPGEVARAHRHSAGAFRFVIQGDGGYTTVNGERFFLRPADLVLTPQGSWHDHGNLSAEPIIWLDVLDFPFVRNINAVFFDSFNAAEQEVTRPDGHSRRAAGPLRPAATPPVQGVPYHYSGADGLAALDALDAEPDPFDGLTLDYVNPLTGGPTLATVQCRLHKLVRGTPLGRHRHTWNTIFHVVRGRGETAAGDQLLSWSAHDTFSVPAWHWHTHRVTMSEDAVLFSVTDEPILRGFGLDRMQEAG